MARRRPRPVPPAVVAPPSTLVVVPAGPEGVRSALAWAFVELRAQVRRPFAWWRLMISAGLMPVLLSAALGAGLAQALTSPHPPAPALQALLAGWWGWLLWPHVVVAWVAGAIAFEGRARLGYGLIAAGRTAGWRLWSLGAQGVLGAAAIAWTVKAASAAYPSAAPVLGTVVLWGWQAIVAWVALELWSQEQTVFGAFQASVAAWRRRPSLLLAMALSVGALGALLVGAWVTVGVALVHGGWSGAAVNAVTLALVPVLAVTLSWACAVPARALLAAHAALQRPTVA